MTMFQTSSSTECSAAINTHTDISSAPHRPLEIKAAADAVLAYYEARAVQPLSASDSLSGRRCRKLDNRIRCAKSDRRCQCGRCARSAFALATLPHGLLPHRGLVRSDICSAQHRRPVGGCGVIHRPRTKTLVSCSVKHEHEWYDTECDPLSLRPFLLCHVAVDVFLTLNTFKVILVDEIVNFLNKEHMSDAGKEEMLRRDHSPS
jgi:hypothetical protein